ncbi:serine-rich adhesin for platelets isoform X1 [Microplitis demolitor]|uniref:serine-rich adhesin for platelets isoform X1 n=1 Tax=Microplitis demolitor TaxID=69319 RepID=UPI0004CD5E4C|nr:serine-rich adhesin for platelets isoform X1 [Microplitis demolitor]
MLKNTGESRIPVSRVPRPSFLLKPKIVGPSKHTPIINPGPDHKRKSIITGCFSPIDPDETILLRTPRTWTSDNNYTSTSSDTAKRSDTIFKSPGVWNPDSNLQHDSPSQRKEDKYFNKFYDSSSMIDDIGSSCLIDSSSSSTFDVSGSSCLNTSQQYLVLNKQNSFEHDESLGILTPDQMTDFTIALGCSRTPSYENLTGSRVAVTSSSSSRASRPTNIPFVVDVDVPGNFCERSPSLEELPLDDSKPLDVKLIIDHQTANNTTTTATATAGISSVAVSNASLPMSFVTSVTSITSLEAGYQGDGENSRPASRGPDPPLVLPDNLPGSCQACRLQDPMTDSDFFTESDADAHEDIGRGDRRAQVIDGTLFCAPAGRRCPSFAGEEMDSSGIYSDLDKRHDERYNLEEPLSEDQTPDTANTGDTPDTQVSPKSRLSPILKPEVPLIITNYLQVPKSPEDMSIEVTPEKNEVTVIHVANDSVERSSTPKLINKSDSTGLKKYKMPKKNVASKIKAMIECGVKEDVKEPRRVSRSPRKSGRWDAVMSKIEAGKTEQRTRPPRKEIKSRILQNLVATSSSSSSSSTSSSSAVTVASAKRSPGDANNNSNANKDKRRTRIRQSNASPTQETARSSVRSSMSDISSATSKGTASKRSPANINQQRRIVNGRGSLKQNTLNNDAKKACTLDLSPLNLDKSPTPIRKSSSIRRATTLTNGVGANEKQQNGSGLIKDRIIKETTASPVISPRVKNIETRHQEAQTTDINNEAKRTDDIIQALCITVQYLTQQLDDYAAMTQTKLYNLKNAYGNLEETLDKERRDHEKEIDELRMRLEGIHKERIKDLENVLQEERDEFQVRLKTSLDKLAREHEVIIDRLKSEQELEIKAKENYWNSKQAALESLDIKSELESLKNEYESLKLSIKPVMSFKNTMIKKLKCEIENLKRQVNDKNKLEKRVKELEYQKDKELKISKDIMIYSDNSPSEIESTPLSSDQVAVLRAEIWSLRSVLELRSQENSSMRSENDMLRREVEGKEALEQRVETLEARCEDLKAQLQSKESYERQIAHENEILLGSFHEISKQNKRVTQKNEELQWRLRQKSEVVSVLANQLATPTQRLSRSLGPEHIEHSITAEKNSPATSSSMIKFMVHKGDSVSWTLEIDESCDPLPNADSRPAVSRQHSLRRTPRKSLDIRARSKSVSTTDVVTNSSDWTPNYNSTPRCARRRPRSDPSSNAIVANPPLVSANEANTGPRPQEAGGEAMISEETASATSSEDESSASSDLPRLPMGFDWNDSVE